MVKYNIRNIDDHEYSKEYEMLENTWGMKIALFLKYLIILPLVKETGREQSVLDIGCAHGFFLRFLLKKGFKNLFGMDIINVLYKDVNESPYVTCIEQSILSQDITLLGRFDAINISGMLHHLPPDELGNVARRLSKMLKSGGSLYIYEPNRFSCVGRVVYDAILPTVSPLLHRMSQIEFEIQRAFVAQMPNFVYTLQKDFEITSYSDRSFFYSIVAKRR